MSKYLLCLGVFIAILFVPSCRNRQGNRLIDYKVPTTAFEDTPVNPIEQALPVIAVLPSDNLLKKYGALKIDQNDEVVRDYQRYLLSNKDNKQIISAIQNVFIQMSYPLTDLEQSLKSLQNQDSYDVADGLKKDSKTILLTTLRPDIVLELDYAYKVDSQGYDYQQKLSYTLSAIDPYTDKVFSTHTYSNLSGNSAAEAMQASLKKNFKQISGDIRNYFGDIVYKGREITVRVALEGNCPFKLSDESIYGESYTDWIMDYIRKNATKGTYNMVRNTDVELYFTNVRIPILNPDGTQFGAYDWARELCRALRSECGVSATNKSQGLGEILIAIKGLK